MKAFSGQAKLNADYLETINIAAPWEAQVLGYSRAVNTERSLCPFGILHSLSLKMFMEGSVSQ